MGNFKRKQNPASGIEADMKLISDDLAEEICTQGAFCQDYDDFKMIYRFVARSLTRGNNSSYLILLTLTDNNGEFPTLALREEQMALLKNVIQSSMRLGDVFTKYSSCQFLIMVPGTTDEDVELISNRIHNLFFTVGNLKESQLLLHCSYPVLPAKPKDK